MAGGQASALEEAPGIVSFGFLGASEQQCQCIEAWSMVERGLGEQPGESAWRCRPIFQYLRGRG